MNNGRAAFFDMDKTILSENSGNLYIKYMRQTGRVSRWMALRGIIWYLQYHLKFFNIEKIAKKTFASVEGDREPDMIKLCNRWFDEMVKNYIYPEVKPLMETHSGAGDLVAILSGGTQYAVRPLSNYLGLSKYICTHLEAKDGILTGKVIEPLCYGEGKVYWAKRFCRENGLDLSKSYFYTDSITDLPLLELVGHPRIVNPDPLLKKEAQNRGWEIQYFSRMQE